MAAKAAAIQAIRAGVTGHAVHQTTAQTIRDWGFSMGLPDQMIPLNTLL